MSRGFFHFFHQEWVETLIIDRKFIGLSHNTISFYKKKLYYAIFDSIQSIVVLSEATMLLILTSIKRWAGIEMLTAAIA